ncbi:MAG: universal stress protein [Rubrivivax sp.]|nr:universal stress protein [Rubrivivax sp.]
MTAPPQGTMKTFGSILLPLDGSASGAQGIGCAAWLADQLGATLHVLSATPKPLPPAQALEELRVPERQRARVSLHQPAADPPSAVLEAIRAHAVDLVVISARGESARAGDELAGLVGHVARAVIEQSDAPVVLLPPRYREALPWESILVPTSGEAAADEAIVVAVRLAHAIGLKVVVAHCVDHAAEAEAAALSSYADAPHHEYPRRLQEMLDRAVACCSREQCSRVGDVVMCRGEVTQEVIELVRKRRSSLVALGWHGDFATGHAQVVKRLLGALTCPLLMVTAVDRAPFALHVGDTLEARAASGAPRPLSQP